MGKLVAFEKRRKDRGDGRARNPNGAEILIFTGVRYERGTSLTPDKTSPSRGVKRKRG